MSWVGGLWTLHFSWALSSHTASLAIFTDSISNINNWTNDQTIVIFLLKHFPHHSSTTSPNLPFDVFCQEWDPELFVTGDWLRGELGEQSHITRNAFSFSLGTSWVWEILTRHTPLKTRKFFLYIWGYLAAVTTIWLPSTNTRSKLSCIVLKIFFISCFLYHFWECKID